MAVQDSHEQYRHQSVMTAAPGELTLMLYDGFFRFVKLAEVALNNNNIEDSNYNLKRAQDIVAELMASLDMNYPIAQNLMSLYDFVNRELVEANLRKDPSKLSAPISIMTEIREAWKEALKIARKTIYGKGENTNNS